MTLRTLALVFAVLTIGFALVGHYKAGAAADAADDSRGAIPAARSGWLAVQALASTTQIFPRGGGVMPNPPWELEIARLLALITSAFAAVEIWRNVFYRTASRMRVRFLWRGHTLVCGLGRKGRRLAEVLRGQTRRVAVIEKSASPAGVVLARRMGVSLLDGDASDTAILDLAGIGKAGAAYIVSGKDETNLEIAMQMLARYRAIGARQTFVCNVHIVRLAFVELLQRQKWLDSERGDFQLRFFNFHQNVARQLFIDHPLEGAAPPPGGVHLVIVGFGELGEAILLQSALIAHFPGGASFHATVVTAGAEARKASFLARQPAFEDGLFARMAVVEFVERPQIEHTNPLGEIIDAMPEAQRLMVIVALEDDSANLAYALRIASSPGPRKFPVCVQIAEQEGMASLLEHAERSSAAQQIHPFGSVETSCGPDMLFGRELDKVARGIHEFYLRNYPPKPGDPPKPSARPWEKLGEDFKQANRAQADHIDVKLRAIGCGRVPAGAAGAKFSFADVEVEMLSKMEHNRWMAERLISGWRYAPETDPLAKQHSSLVPWERLSDKERKKDADAVRAIPDLLAEAGFGIRRGKN